MKSKPIYQPTGNRVGVNITNRIPHYPQYKGLLLGEFLTRIPPETMIAVGSASGYFYMGKACEMTQGWMALFRQRYITMWRRQAADLAAKAERKTHHVDDPVIDIETKTKRPPTEAERNMRLHEIDALKGTSARDTINADLSIPFERRRVLAVYDNIMEDNIRLKIKVEGLEQAYPWKLEDWEPWCLRMMTDRTARCRKMSKIRVIICPANAAPYVAYIHNDLKTMQQLVKGYIKNVQVCTDVAIICNEEGRNLDMPENKSLFVKGFVGDCFIVGTQDSEYVSLSDEKMRFILRQCMERWNKRNVP